MSRFRVHVEGFAFGAVVNNLSEIEAASPGEAVNFGIADFAVRFGTGSRCDRAYLEVIRTPASGGEAAS